MFRKRWIKVVGFKYRPRSSPGLALLILSLLQRPLIDLPRCLNTIPSETPSFTLMLLRGQLGGNKPRSFELISVCLYIYILLFADHYVCGVGSLMHPHLSHCALKPVSPQQSCCFFELPRDGCTFQRHYASTSRQ